MNKKERLKTLRKIDKIIRQNWITCIVEEHLDLKQTKKDLVLMIDEVCQNKI